MPNLSLFNFHKNEIRMVEIDGEPWFLAKDVCDLLGFKSTAGMGWLTRHLKPDQIRTIKRSNITSSEVIDLKQPGTSNITQRDIRFPNRGAVAVSESGLYLLVMRSDKPEAKKFQNWVCEEVLPSIRKHGMYVMGQEKIATGEITADEFTEMAKSFLEKKVGRLQAERQSLADNTIDLQATVLQQNTHE